MPGHWLDQFDQCGTPRTTRRQTKPTASAWSVLPAGDTQDKDTIDQTIGVSQ